MDNSNLILLLGGGALIYWLYQDGKKNTAAPIGTANIKITDGVKTAPNGTTTPIAKVGGNPKTEEQPIISTNNAQQPPTIVEDKNNYFNNDVLDRSLRAMNPD